MARLLHQQEALQTETLNPIVDSASFHLLTPWIDIVTIVTTGVERRRQYTEFKTAPARYQPRVALVLKPPTAADKAGIETSGRNSTTIVIVSLTVFPWALWGVPVEKPRMMT
jgi:hypothetical protein